MLKKLSILALTFTLIMCKKSDNTTTTTQTSSAIVGKWTIVKETFKYNNGSTYVYTYPAGSYIEFKNDNTYNYFNADKDAKPNNCSGNYKVTGVKINLQGCLYSVGDGDILNQTSSSMQVSYQDNSEQANLVFDLTK